MTFNWGLEQLGSGNVFPEKWYHQSCALGNKPSSRPVMSIKNKKETNTTDNDMLAVNTLLVWTKIAGEEREVRDTWFSKSLNVGSEARKSQTQLRFQALQAWITSGAQKEHTCGKRWWAELETHRPWGANSSTGEEIPRLVWSFNTVRIGNKHW